MESPLKLNDERFKTLLGKLIGESKFVQNMPPKLIPEEDLVVAHVLEALKPHTGEGGPLTVNHIHFKEKRGNLIIEYKPEGATGTVAFVGSHLDVVPADPETWEVDPFSMTEKGDKLYGRGTTDCLGHVALITEMMIQLAETKPKLTNNIFVCFIASEENASIPDVGVDKVMEAGYLDAIKNGPVFWIDSADSEPCIGTAAAIQWTLKAEGKLFHSGLPHKGINSLELASEAMAEVQKRFYADFPECENDRRWMFQTPSTMKPTKIRGPDNSVNQVPPWTEIEGDIRLTPFYEVDDAMKAVEGYVADINKNIQYLPTRGPVSKYIITEEEGNELRGKVSVTWGEQPFKGIACDLDSRGYSALVDATKFVKGKATPFSVNGSLPLVGDMKAAGYDLQICGFGKSSVYHGNNEYCSMKDMQDAIQILSKVVMILD